MDAKSFFTNAKNDNIPNKDILVSADWFTEKIKY